MANTKDADRLRQSAKPNQVEVRGAIFVFPEDMQFRPLQRFIA
jgi:hypothetical protein